MFVLSFAFARCEMCLYLGFFFCSAAFAGAAVLDAVGGAVPVVDVSLAPAEAPPELVDAIADFDEERARFEKASEDSELLTFQRGVGSREAST